jgi:hypothetical protein
VRAAQTSVAKFLAATALLTVGRCRAKQELVGSFGRFALVTGDLLTALWRLGNDRFGRHLELDASFALDTFCRGGGGGARLEGGVGGRGKRMSRFGGDGGVK